MSTAPTPTVIDPATLQAYRETHYRVHGARPCLLQVDHPSPALAAIHRAADVDSSAYITACNPFSRPCDTATNTARQDALVRELRQRQLAFIDGFGQHPDNDRPGEASVLVLGSTLEEAGALGVRHEQNAILWAGADAVPRLILLR